MTFNLILLFLMILLVINITNIASQKIKNKKRKKIIANEETIFKNKVDLDASPVVIVTNREGISNNMRRIAYVINKIGDNRKWGLTYFESRFQDVSQWFCLFDFIDLSDQTASCIHLTEFSEIRLETCHFSALGPFDITPSMLDGLSWNLPQFERNKAAIPTHRPFNYSKYSNDMCVLPSKLGYIPDVFVLRKALIHKAKMMIKELFIDDYRVQSVEGVWSKRGPIYFAFHWRRGDQLTDPQRCKRFYNPLVCDATPEALLRRLKSIHPLWFIATDEKDPTIRNMLSDGLPGVTVRLLPLSVYQQEGFGSAFFLDIALQVLARRYYAVQYPVSDVRLLVEHFRRQWHHIPKLLSQESGDTIWLDRFNEDE